MSLLLSANFKKRLIAAAVLMIFITAAAFVINVLSVKYLVLYDSDTGERYITEKAEENQDEALEESSETAMHYAQKFEELYHMFNERVGRK